MIQPSLNPPRIDTAADIVGSNDLSQENVISKRVWTSLILMSVWFFTVSVEMTFTATLSAFSTPTLFDHIQSTVDAITSGSPMGKALTCVFLTIILCGMLADNGLFTIYLTFLKLFELLLPLVDLINIFFIYIMMMQHTHKLHSFEESPPTPSTGVPLRFILTSVFCLVRLVIALHMVRRKPWFKAKRSGILLLDLCLHVLITVSLLRYSTKSPVRILRKIVAGMLLFQSISFDDDEQVWIRLIGWIASVERRLNSERTPDRTNVSRKHAEIHAELLYRSSLHITLVIREIVSAVIIAFFMLSIFHSSVLDTKYDWSPISYALVCAEHFLTVAVGCMFILGALHMDVCENRKSLQNSNVATRPKQPCQVCLEDKDWTEFDGLSIPDCQHPTRTICDACTIQHVQIAFRVRFTDDVYCPESECGVKFDSSIVSKLLALSNDQTLVDRYERYVLHREIEKMDGFVWCSNPKCNSGQLNEGGASNRIVTCHSCRQKTCFVHKVRWHEGLTCDEYSYNIGTNDEKSQEWILTNAKKCPRCPYHIQKNDGCDHMTCTRCRHQFCWLCLADFEPIRRDGNHRHQSTCKHYSVQKRAWRRRLYFFFLTRS